jgi:hypothetical protein
MVVLSAATQRRQPPICEAADREVYVRAKPPAIAPRVGAAAAAAARRDMQLRYDAATDRASASREPAHTSNNIRDLHYVVAMDVTFRRASNRDREVAFPIVHRALRDDGCRRFALHRARKTRLVTADRGGSPIAWPIAMSAARSHLVERR